MPNYCKTDVSRSFFKAFIRVVKSIAFKDPNEYMGFDTVEVLREPLIEAKDKAEVKAILLEKYPQFFQNGKVYEKETKDQAQFFYVVIFPLYQHEIELIKEGEWKCDYCGHIHENKYFSRPLASRKFDGKIFCGSDYKTGNDIVSEPNCYERWKKEVAFKFKRFHPTYSEAISIANAIANLVKLVICSKLSKSIVSEEL